MTKSLTKYNRQKYSFLALLAVFVVIAAFCIDLTHAEDDNEALYADKQAYLKKLMHLHQKMASKVTQLKQLNKQVMDNSDNLQGHSTLQKNVLQQGMSIERTAIKDVFDQTKVPIEDNYWTCKDLTPDEKKLFEQKILNLKSKISSIENQLQSQGDCIRNTELNHHIQFLRLHVESLEKELSNTCEPPTRQDNYPTDNLDTDKNWIYGDLTPKKYDQAKEKLDQQYKLYECPDYKPFVIDGKCEHACEDGKVFSMSSKECTECTQGEIFLKENHQCRNPNDKEKISDLEDVPFIWGGITQEQYKKQVQQFKEHNMTENCQQDKPVSTGRECMNCNGVYNVNYKECSSCKQNLRYDQDDQSCKPYTMVPNFSKGPNWIADPSDKDAFDERIRKLKQDDVYLVQTCPDNKPFPTQDEKGCMQCDRYYDIKTRQCKGCEKYFVFKADTNQCVYFNGNCQGGKVWNGQVCIWCKQPGHYDENLKECKCPDEKKYDIQSGECLLSGNVKNFNPKTAINYIGTKPEVSKFLQNCPQNQPFYSYQKQGCMQCPLPEFYFNFYYNECHACLQGYEFSIEKKMCQKAFKNYNTNLNGVSNYCCGDIHYDGGLQTCPSGTPYFDGTHCISCTTPNFFNIGKKQCQSCPYGQSFSTIAKKCVNSSFLLPKFISNNPSGLGNYMGSIPVVLPDFVGQLINTCPSDKPYYTGQYCIKCQLPKYFNFNSKTCEICQAGKSFNVNKKQCSKNSAVGDYYNSNMIGDENFIGKLPDYDSSHQTCNEQTRYFDGSECIYCQIPNYFDFNNKQCKSCESGRYFDTTARKCFYSQQAYSTNMDAQNIFYNGNFANYKDSVEDQGRNACPSSQPFFDKQYNQCTKCQGDEYIWNILKNHCMSCRRDTYFNQDHHICFQNGVNPTLERMAMNSVNWL